MGSFILDIVAHAVNIKLGKLRQEDFCVQGQLRLYTKLQVKNRKKESKNFYKILGARGGKGTSAANHLSVHDIS